MFGTRSLSANAHVASVNSSDGTLIASENFNRICITLLNVSTSVMYVNLGASALTTEFNFVLSADSAAKSGFGGSAEMKTWKGSIYALAASTGTHYLAVTEEVENT